MTARLTIFQRAVEHRLCASGMSLRDIAKEIGCSHSGIDVALCGQERAPKPGALKPRLGHLRASEREEILLGLQYGQSMSAGARDLDQLPSTVSREVKTNGGGENHRVWPAHLRAQKCTLRPRPSKLKNAPYVRK